MQFKLDIPEKRLLNLFSPREIKHRDNVHQEIAHVLNNTMALNRLEDMIKSTDTVAIVVEKPNQASSDKCPSSSSDQADKKE